MQYIEIIQTQSATVVETIKVRVLVPNGMTQEEFRYHLDDEGIASEFTEVHEDDAYIQYDNDDHRWLQPQTLRCLAAHLFPAPEGPNPRQAVMLTEANFRKTIDELPERVVRGLFYLVLTESKLASFGDAMHLVGAKGVAPE